jgi:hypothetical protein
VVLVEHRYRTSLGISFDSIMRKAMASEDRLAKETQRYRRDYCISDGFLADLDKIAGDTQKQYFQDRGASDQLCAEDRRQLGNTHQTISTFGRYRKGRPVGQLLRAQHRKTVAD